MIPALLFMLLLAFGATQAFGESGFDAALRLAGQGRYRDALEAAAREEDPLRRAQAIVYTRHLAGDLRGALAEARRGLELSPGDVWLLEQGAFIALSLHEGALGESLAARLVRALPEEVALEPAARAQALARAEGLLAEAQAARAGDRARRRALVRARTASLAILAGSLLLAAWLGLLPPRQGSLEA